MHLWYSYHRIDNRLPFSLRCPHIHPQIHKSCICNFILYFLKYFYIRSLLSFVYINKCIFFTLNMCICCWLLLLISFLSHSIEVYSSTQIYMNLVQMVNESMVTAKPMTRLANKQFANSHTCISAYANSLVDTYSRVQRSETDLPESLSHFLGSRRKAHFLLSLNSVIVLRFSFLPLFFSCPVQSVKSSANMFVWSVWVWMVPHLPAHFCLVKLKKPTA